MCWRLCVLLAFFLIGCGPSLTRPGYTPPKDPPVVPPLVAFQNAETDTLNNLLYRFTYTKFSVLDGVKQEVYQVLSKYPPNLTGKGRAFDLRIDGLIDQFFKASAQSLGLSPHDMECVRDYTNLCPYQWTDVGDGMTCEGPPSMFSNPECQTVKFGGMSPLEKSAAAFACAEAKYPCRNACMEDYSVICPTGWERHGRTAVCMAPQDYLEPCVKVYDFADHNSRLKRKFSNMCKVNWPCKGRFSQVNPHVP
jgi:CPW-WPC domain-containing protein